MNEQALTVVESAPPAEVAPANVTTLPAPATPQQLRVIEVNEALAPAYARASTLELTDAEVAALMAPFPDDVVEIRPHDGLIYIPHIFISNRLNEVFRPGKWAMVCRRHWLEGETMYGEYVLLIRGCFIGESVGGHPYVANNPKVNYSDTLESTAAEALRRIAGKRLSCGSQVWNPQYARDWVATRGQQVNGKWFKKQVNTPLTPPKTPVSAPSKPVVTSEAPKASQDTPKTPETPLREATEATLKWFLGQMAQFGVIARDYFREIGTLMPNEEMADFPLHKCPTSRATVDSIKAEIEKFHQSHKGETPPADPVPAANGVSDPSAGEWWREVVVPIPHKGQKRDEYLKSPDTIGSLYDARHGEDDTSQMARQRLYGFLTHFEAKGWTKRDGTAMPPSAADLKFREALDALGDFLEKQGEKL